MSTSIQIKRRFAGVDPVGGELKEGELAYTFSTDKLFIGGSGGTSVVEIGGNAFSDLLTATPGVATADKAVILDSSVEIDVWNVVGQLEAGSLKTSASVSAGFVKNDVSGNLLFGETGEQTDLNLTDLADVTLTGPASGELLSYNGAQWVNAAAATLPGVPTVIDDLTDVDTVSTAPSGGDVLTWTGFVWEPVSVLGLGAHGATHESGASDPIDGDKLDITWIPAVYVPLPSVPPHTASPVELTSHLAGIDAALGGLAPAVHTHLEADITDLQSYALAVHTHLEADISDLQNYSLVGHTHTLVDVTDSGTAAAKNVPAVGDAAAGEVVLGNDSRLTDARTPTSHTHLEADITDLQSYALAVHTHLEADITDLQNYSLVGHTHLEADITDLQAYLLNINSEVLGDLFDVSITSPTAFQVLRWESGASEWINDDPDNIGIVTLTATQTLTNKTLTDRRAHV